MKRLSWSNPRTISYFGKVGYRLTRGLKWKPSSSLGGVSMFLAQRNPDYKIRFGLAVLCVAVSLSPTRLRAQQWNVAPFAADARSVYSAASAVSVAPGNDVLVLDEEDSYVFDAKGEATHTRYIVYKIRSEERR